MMKRNELIIRVACLAGLALACMSMVPFVQAATSRSSGTLEPIDIASTVMHTSDTSTTSSTGHCNKLQSEMCDRLARTLEDGERFTNLVDACLRTVDECTDCCVATVEQHGLTVANFATNRFAVPTSTPCTEMVRHIPRSATVSASSSSLEPLAHLAPAGRCNFPQRPDHSCDGAMYWKYISARTVYADTFRLYSEDRAPDFHETSTEVIISSVLTKMRRAEETRNMRTRIEFEAFEGPLPGETLTYAKRSVMLSVVVSTDSVGGVTTFGNLILLERRQCCGGNEILALVHCIFGASALNVQYVDLEDASRTNCRLFTPAVAAEVCPVVLRAGAAGTSALAEACAILIRRVRNNLLPLGFSHSVDSDHYHSWYESNGYRWISDSVRPQASEPYVAAKKAFFEMPFADLDALTRCSSVVLGDGSTVHTLSDIARDWRFSIYAVSEIDSLFDSTTVAPGDTVHVAFRKAYAKIAREFATDKEAAVKHCAALGLYVHAFWGQDIYEGHLPKADGSWCTETNLRHAASVQSQLVPGGGEHGNIRQFLHNHVEGSYFRKELSLAPR